MSETLFKKIIEDKNLTYGVVSKITGVPKSSINNYANGNRIPDVNVAVHIMETLGIDINLIGELFKSSR